MKYIIIAISLVISTLAEGSISLFYHESVGIKKASRIKQAEESDDFDETSRITGGWVARLGDHPHFGGLLITLTSGATSVCGSSLLSNTRAVTAASCWWDGHHQARQFTIVFGSVTLFSGGTRVVTSSVTTHENFNPGILLNNIAMINFNSITFNSNIQPASLPIEFVNNDFVDTSAWAAGFGQVADGVSITCNQVLRHWEFQVISNAACAQVYSTAVQDSTICTDGSRTPPVGICSGDNGGGLWFWRGSQRRVLIGVASFHHQSGCQRGFPTGYVRITSFISWIQARL